MTHSWASKQQDMYDCRSTHGKISFPIEGEEGDLCQAMNLAFPLIQRSMLLY